MPAKAKELNNRREGDRRQCSTCNPRPDRVPLWKVWAWSLAHPGQDWRR
jgi:hypothetical protein